MCLSFCELAEDEAGAKQEQLEDPKTFRIDFPPLFAGTSHEVVANATRRVFANRALVGFVAERTGAKVADMRKLWPHRKGLFAKWWHEVFNRWGYFEDMSLGELG